MKLEIARRLVTEITRKVHPNCDRFEIAGSIRRCKPDVKDIEVVCIPKTFTSSQALLGGKDVTVRSDGFIRTVNQFVKIKGDAREGKYMQRQYELDREDFPGITDIRKINIDIFVATISNWGIQFLTRTGDSDFSRLFLGTILPKHGYKAHDGYVWLGNDVINLPEERDAFALVKIPFIEPQFRNATALNQYL